MAHYANFMLECCRYQLSIRANQNEIPFDFTLTRMPKAQNFQVAHAVSTKPFDAELSQRIAAPRKFYTYSCQWFVWYPKSIRFGLS